MAHYVIRLPSGVALHRFQAECDGRAITKFKDYVEMNYPNVTMDMALTSEGKIHCVRRTITKIVEQTVTEYI